MLDELERLERAATPGPWRNNMMGTTADQIYTHDGDFIAEFWSDALVEDAAFIAAARNALPAMLRVARAAEAFNRTFSAHLAPYLRDTGLGAVAAEFAAALAALNEEA